MRPRDSRATGSQEVRGFESLRLHPKVLVRVFRRGGSGTFKGLGCYRNAPEALKKECRCPVHTSNSQSYARRCSKSGTVFSVSFGSSIDSVQLLLALTHPQSCRKACYGSRM